jgi:metallo-beta-lactamase family protein
MRIKFLGAARQVTGSMHLVEAAGGTILIDCGMFQGRRDESREKNRKLPPEAVKADVMILTHAHIDHSGNIPTLVKNGFRGSIYATPATRDLCAYMLRDSARIQEGDANYLNKKFADDPEWKKVEPLYDEEDAVKALQHIVSVPYGKDFSPLKGVTARMLDAGHILGSAQIALDADGRRLIFSGDLGRKGLPILRDPWMPRPPVDYVVMESTYGARAHGSIAEMHDDLARVVGETVKRGGKVIIPAFSVGRTQEVVYAFNHLRRDGRLPEIPVFIDSPLSVNVTEVFKLHPECFDPETLRFVAKHGDAFGFEGVRYIQSVEESMRLNDLSSPAVIIASSGMCEAGRILHHLRNNVENPNNTVCIVGYQAQHTLGRRIVERRPKIKIHGVERELRAQVSVLNAFSAHGDKHDLMAFARACEGAKQIFLIHGEPEQQDPFLAELAAGGMRASAPAPGDEVELA